MKTYRTDWNGPSLIIGEGDRKRDVCGYVATQLLPSGMSSPDSENSMRPIQPVLMDDSTRFGSTIARARVNCGR
jgi:hypothetical protein